ncbi:MAG: class I SAM-dependent methyltransferase [Chloroflexi bacterium]|nr:class I SAM-dependent methyltransferase [Chloroflexota bacterium]
MESTPQSVNFDRAADIYDATRALPPDVQEALTVRLLELLSDVDRVLEVGIGTGRISRPLAARGRRVCGVDISPLMLQQLTVQLEAGHERPDLALADATRLPFADDSFGAALSFHVVHLIPDWERALDEACRVIGDGGRFIYYRQRDEYKRWMDSHDKLGELLGRRGFTRRKRPTVEEIDEKLRSLGGTVEVEDVAEVEERVTPAELLADTKARTHSWSWEIPDDLFWDFMPEYEEWIKAHWAMDEPRVDTIIHELRVWSFG